MIEIIIFFLFILRFRFVHYETNINYISFFLIHNKSFATHNLPLFHSNLIVSLYILSRIQSHISKYKLNFQNRNYRVFLFMLRFRFILYQTNMNYIIFYLNL